MGLSLARARSLSRMLSFLAGADADPGDDRHLLQRHGRLHFNRMENRRREGILPWHRCTHVQLR